MESNVLPDIQSERKSTNASLSYSEIHKVGMSQVQIPIRLKGQFLTGMADVFVNLLEGKSRGIHMSRLYASLLDKMTQEELNFEGLKKLGRELIQTQEGLSTESYLKIDFSLPLETKSLKSGQTGFRSYPMSLELKTERDKQICKISFQILYSSTCPQSTALSLELWKEEAKKHQNLDWIEKLQGMPAIPHAQRSKAEIQIEIKSNSEQNFETWVWQAEQCLATPVQTLVKRSDEQEFARLNGVNTMFCEDSIRRIESWLKIHPDVLSFWARVEHQESLHPHNAVAETHN
jgi:GTP cyclohydrolase I